MNVNGAICGARKLIPIAFSRARFSSAPDPGITQILLVCVRPPEHYGDHACGHDTWMGDQRIESTDSEGQR